MSYQIVGNPNFDSVGSVVSFVEDIDGDGLSEVLIGGPNANINGEAYLLFSSEFAALDAVDGVIDGVIHLDAVLKSTELVSASYTFGTSVFSGFDSVGTDVSGGADLNGDGAADLLISAPDSEGSVLVIFSDSLAELDGSDGSVDGLIELQDGAQT